MKERVSVVLAVAVLLLSRVVQGYGPWLDRTPIGGVELSEGLAKAELVAGVEKIAAAETDRPFIATRARQLAFVFDNAKLAVNTNDLFVHWHPGSSVLPEQCNRLRRDWMKKLDGGWLDTSHTCPDWKSVIALGPKGLAARAAKRLETAKTEDERVFLASVVTCYEALARQCVRWADFAAAKGMRETAATLREIAAHEPRTFREALQWSLVYDRAQETEGEDVRSQGLFDRLFIDLYRADLAAGRETRESAKKLIASLYTCYWKQQHPNCKNIAFGGCDAAGNVVWNELTELGFEVFRELGRINPKLTFRFGRKTPRGQLEKVCAILAEGKTSVVFACEETLGEMFRRRGKTPEDVADYVLVGCYEPGIGGREIVASMTWNCNLAAPFADILKGGKKFADVEALFAEYERLLTEMIDERLERVRRTEEHWYEINPSPLFSGSMADCIAAAKDLSRGGCRYNSSGVDCAGLATVADSFAAVEYLVGERHLVTVDELNAVLAADWKDREDLRLAARNGAPKWGNNDERADKWAKRVYGVFTKRINSQRNGHGGGFQAGSWSIELDRTHGSYTVATADGRRKGETLSRNNAATAGCGREGPLALMNSNLKLDLAEAPDGHIMDVILPVSKMKGANAAKNVASVIAAYFARGGQCLHLNVFDTATLRDAMAHPEKYPDLQVRLCGWNVLWKELTREQQLHFLKTCEAFDPADEENVREVRNPVELKRAILDARAGGAKTIKLASGLYELDEPLTLTAADSGLALVGGKGTRLTRSIAAVPDGVVESAPTNRPPPMVGWAAARATLPMFFYDGKFAIEARWPNEGYTNFTEVVDSGVRSVMRAGVPPEKFPEAGSFRFRSDRPLHWNFEEGVWFEGYATHDWAYERLRLGRFDPTNRVMYMSEPAQYGLSGQSWSMFNGRRFRVSGPRSELDAPGEYFFDRKTKKVDFIAPEGGVKEFRAVVKGGGFLCIDGARGVSVRGVEFAFCQGDAVTVTNAEDVVFADCRFTGVGGNAMTVADGRACHVVRCLADGLGRGGFLVSGGDRKTLTRCDHLVEDCEIRDYGRICRTYSAAISLSGCGLTARRCRIHDSPHTAILYGRCNETLIEDNEIYDIMYETGDVGAIYAGRDPTTRGNVIRGNYIHDCSKIRAGRTNVMALYLDDCDAGDSFVSNRIERVPRGMMHGGGQDVHLIGNTFKDCDIGISVDARALGWAGNLWDNPKEYSWQMTRKVKEMPVASEPWRSKYPLLVNYLEDHPKEPRHCSIVGNVFVNCTQPLVFFKEAQPFIRDFDLRDNLVRPVSPMKVVLSFDDGLKDHLLIAAPELEKRGWRGVFNVFGGDEDKTRTNHLSWADCAELVRRGHELGNHTLSHANLVKLLEEGKTNEVRREFSVATSNILAHTGYRTRFMCYPFTRLNAATDRLCREEGLEPMSKVPRTNFGEGNEDETERFLTDQLLLGARSVDVLVHGVTRAGGGWRPFADRAAFVRHLDVIKRFEEQGLIVVTDYATAHSAE